MKNYIALFFTAIALLSSTAFSQVTMTNPSAEDRARQDQCNEIASVIYKIAIERDKGVSQQKMTQSLTSELGANAGQLVELVYSNDARQFNAEDLQDGIFMKCISGGI